MSNSWKFALKKIIAEQLREGAYPFKKDKNAKEGKKKVARHYNLAFQQSLSVPVGLCKSSACQG